MKSFSENGFQYVKYLGNGEHLLWDYIINSLEIWTTRRIQYKLFPFKGISLSYKNTNLYFKQDYHDQSLKFKKKLNSYLLETHLPRGVGINGKWSIEENRHYFKAINFYQCMNNYSLCIGHADFYVKIPKNAPRNFKIYFSGIDAYKMDYMFSLKKTLEEIIKLTVEEIMEELE